MFLVAICAMHNTNMNKIWKYEYILQIYKNIKIWKLFTYFSGAAGTHCELDALDECASKPCSHGAVCQDRVGDYACYCPPSWAGKNCDTYDPLFRGGVGRVSIKVWQINCFISISSVM